MMKFTQLNVFEEYHFILWGIYYVYTFLIGDGIMDTKKKLEDKINQRIGDDYMSTVTAQKWGNSLGIRIPKEAADRIGIGQGSEMELRVVGGESITLKPKRTPKKYTLEELLAQITPKNRHEEIDFGTERRELL